MFFFVKNVSYFLIRNSYYWRIAKKYHLSTLFGRNNSAIVLAKVLQFIRKFYITQNKTYRKIAKIPRPLLYLERKYAKNILCYLVKS